MRKNNYILEAEVNPNAFICYNSFTDRFLILNKEKYLLYNTCDLSKIEETDSLLGKNLSEGLFLVPDDYNELDITLMRKIEMQTDASMYQLVINTTLDCNLNCWYCYENRVAGSKLTAEVINGIKKNIAGEYALSPYNTLKISFFGGEPFVEFGAIKEILDFADDFCQKKEIVLIADFTTNAVLITKEHIDYLKRFRCHFQITLDGDREIHNKVKKDVTGRYLDTYQKNIEALTMINQEIPKHWIAVRINFDNRTLGRIDEIINDIDFLERRSCFVILKKVWQIDTEKVNKELLLEAIQKLFDKKFLVDYYIMPKGSVCFAEHKRQVLFNYDGKVFKCSTISSFDDKNALGKFNLETGQVVWDSSKMAQWFKDIQPEYCKQCRWFPACLGVCNKQLMAHPNEKICTFDSMNLDEKEYLMYSFKYHFLQNELIKS